MAGNKFFLHLISHILSDSRHTESIHVLQELPYISPYEDAFHLAPSSDQSEKWTVAVLHELLWLLVSKKTERDNLFYLGDFLGFGTRFKKALVHHPGIFYISNKLRTQTVVLREAYRKDFLVESHPLMGMRHRYVHLMNKSVNRSGTVNLFSKGRKELHISGTNGTRRKKSLLRLRCNKVENNVKGK